MQLVNEFSVNLPAEEAWLLLTDLQKVAPCLPGAHITDKQGDEYHGHAKIKVGPITVEYKGVAQFTSLDAGAKTAVLLARGKDARGQGDATATVTAQLATLPDGGTKVEVRTDLALTGKVAQFGRGVIGEVSGALMDLFAIRLQEMVSAQGGLTAKPATSTPIPAALQPTDGAAESALPAASRPTPTPDANDEVLDLLSLAGGMSWTKALPSGAAAVAVGAALISVFAAGYASARARATGR
ncbi:MAG: SRPBCC family protein [Nocardioidaceae bacterium]|nr:MAG: SRPBCC family protein [Nocardioidaceae bacterium]